MDDTRLGFDNSYKRLPDRFYVAMPPEPVVAPRLIAFNRPLAQALGLAHLEADAADIFSGNAVPAGAEPIALAYAGHQFGSFVRQLGDGRAILLGEVIDRDGQRRDIQLKGSGRTPFSRRGDGRAALGPVLREYLISEAMHALGIPTTRALAAVTTGEPVYRERVLPGAVLTRVAASHVRVGTFEYFAARGDVDAVRALADYVIARHYPDLTGHDRPCLALLAAVTEHQASLIARWMHVGFIHGVMNTDNTAVSGETIDYGPCAFMDTYDPKTVFSSIDHGGRYAYGRQPQIAAWNLARLAEALLPLLDPEPETAVERANEVLGAFSEQFQRVWLDGVRRKLGLVTVEPDDLVLVRDLLDAMHQQAADYTLTFRRLCDAADAGGTNAEARTLFQDPAAFDNWAVRWRARLERDPQSSQQRAAGMRSVNPAFIPRNHRVEEALHAAVEEDDLAPFERLRAVLERPYEDQPQMAAYADPPEPSDEAYQTFCGT